jgi:cytochrome b
MDKEAQDRPGHVSARVWDLPTRLFHWALVVLLVISYVTAQLDELEWHMRSGECILALLLFRLGWGVVGSDTARFARFVRGPRAVWRHFFWSARLGEGRPHDELGHNAAGGWAVLAMLFVLCLQVGTGLFADDDISETGPFGQFVSRPVRKFLTGLHQRNFNVLAALVALHVAAITAYRLFRQKNLIWPMLTGVARLPAGVAPPRLRGLLLAGTIFAVAAGVAAWVASFQDAAD